MLATNLKSFHKAVSTLLLIVMLGSFVPTAPAWAQTQADEQAGTPAENNTFLPTVAGGNDAGQAAGTPVDHHLSLPLVEAGGAEAPGTAGGLTGQAASLPTSLCPLYPLALYAATLAAINPGQEVRNVLNGA